MFCDLGASGAIVRALKQRFDPTGVLNPGRFAGRN
jgi:FAD/FMN-containing dehydrogenase